jgi:hypothetical protein
MSTTSSPENQDNRGNVASRKGLAEIEEENMLVYETETQQSRKIKRRALQASYQSTSSLSLLQGLCMLILRQETKAKEPTFLPVSIRQGTRNVDVVLPADQEHSLGATQIASVPIPWTVFLKNSLSRNRRVLYVTGRC